MLYNTLATNVEQIAFIRKMLSLREREQGEVEAGRRRVEDCNSHLSEENVLMKQELEDYRSEVSFLKTTIQNLEAKLESDEACQEENDATILHLQSELFTSTEILQHAITDFSIATDSELETYQEFLGAKHQAMVEFERNIEKTKIQSVLWQELQEALVHAHHWEDKHNHVYSALNQCMTALIASRKDIEKSGKQMRDLQKAHDEMSDWLRSSVDTNINLRARVENDAETIQELNNQLQQAKGITHGSERVIRKHKQEAAMYKEQLAPYQQKEQELSAKIYDLKDKLEVSQRSEKAIRKEWKVTRELVRYLEADKRIVADKTQAQIKAKEVQIKAKDEQIKEKEEVLASIQQQLQEALAQDTSKANEELIAQLDNLQSQLDGSTTDNTKISRDLAARDMETRTQLTQALDRLNASNERLSNDLDAQRVATAKDMHDAQTTIRRLQARARLADKNSGFWADALADGVGMSAEWRAEMKRLDKRRGDPHSSDARMFESGKLTSVSLRIRGLLAEKEEMLKEIKELRGAALLAERGMSRGRTEEDMRSEQSEEQFGRFAEVYESVGGDVGEAVRQTLSERGDSSRASSRAGEAGSVNGEEDEEEVVVPVLTRRASWS